MPKKKSLPPRKRRRVIRKIIFFAIVFLVVLLVSGALSYYFFALKGKKPDISSLLPQKHVVLANTDAVSEQALQSGLRRDNISYSAIKKGYDSYTITLDGGGKVTFSTQKDIMLQIASLQYILSHLTMEGRQFSSLDLRFEKPVIVIE